MKKNINNLPINYKISGTKIYIPFKAICSVTSKEFSGEIIIEYEPKRTVLEYVNTEKYVNKISKHKTTAEELAHTLYLAVSESINPKSLRVTVDVKHSRAHKSVQVWIES